MEDVIQAYLDMSKISILPLRSWSLIHEALSCACVLALLQPTSTDLRVDPILEKIQELLNKESESSDGSSPLSKNGFVCRGVKLLKFLREHGGDIMRSAASTLQPVEAEGSAAEPELGPTRAVLESDLGCRDATTLSTTSADGIDSGLDQSWWEPFLLDTGLDNSLSTFLDLSSDFFQ